MARHRLTGSRLYLADACPASHALPWVESTSEAAERGTEIHAALQRGESVEGLDVALLVPPSHGIDEREVAYAFDCATGNVRRLDNLGRDYDVSDTEIPCRLDRVFEDVGGLHVVDYKSGQEPPAAEGNAQLLLGAVCAAWYHGEDEALASIVAIDHGGKWDTVELDLFDLDAAADKIARIHDRVERATDDVRLGSHCRYCPAMAACPAYAGIARWTLDTVPVVGALSLEDVGVVWERLAQAKRFVDELERAIKARIDQEGSVPLPGGGRVRPVTSARRSLDPVIASSIMSDYGVDVSPYIKRSIDVGIVDELMGPRSKDVWAALRSAGAVRTSETISYRKVK